MRAQTALNRLMKFAYKQGCKSETPYEFGATCLLKDGRGNSCFLGAFIPDEKYKYDLEGQGASYIINSDQLSQYFDIDGFPVAAKINFWRTLQSIHDDYAVKAWPDEFAQLARDFDLKIEVQQ